MESNPKIQASFLLVMLTADVRIGMGKIVRGYIAFSLFPFHKNESAVRRENLLMLFVSLRIVHPIISAKLAKSPSTIQEYFFQGFLEVEKKKYTRVFKPI
jgi:hypothetical protein